MNVLSNVSLELIIIESNFAAGDESCGRYCYRNRNIDQSELNGAVMYMSSGRVFFLIKNAICGPPENSSSL